MKKSKFSLVYKCYYQELTTFLFFHPFKKKTPMVCEAEILSKEILITFERRRCFKEEKKRKAGWRENVCIKTKKFLFSFAVQTRFKHAGS